MTPTEALDQLIDTGKLTREAFEVVFQAGYVDRDPFSRSGWRATTKGQLALAARKEIRASSRPGSTDRPDESTGPRE